MNPGALPFAKADMLEGGKGQEIRFGEQNLFFLLIS
jgi:hypothetical protein